MLATKLEHGQIDKVEPSLEAENILKVCTFKSNPHNTKLGQRFISIICREALDAGARYAYATVFPKHEGLLRLLLTYGFEYHGQRTDTGEDVYVKDFEKYHGDIRKDFPRIPIAERRFFWLGIDSEYHTKMFPDSIVKPEKPWILKDCPHTNAIHKIYVCRMQGVRELRKGDIVFIYRNAPKGTTAHYTGCVTSICVVEERRNAADFPTLDAFFEYTHQFNLFERHVLASYYDSPMGQAIKMTYNGVFAMPKPTLREVRETIGELPYWGFSQLTTEQAKALLKLGKINEGFIIH